MKHATISRVPPATLYRWEWVKISPTAIPIRAGNNKNGKAPQHKLGHELINVHGPQGNNVDGHDGDIEGGHEKGAHLVIPGDAKKGQHNARKDHHHPAPGHGKRRVKHLFFCNTRGGTAILTDKHGTGQKNISHHQGGIKALVQGPGLPDHDQFGDPLGGSPWF